MRLVMGVAAVCCVASLSGGWVEEVRLECGGERRGAAH